MYSYDCSGQEQCKGLKFRHVFDGQRTAGQVIAGIRNMSGYLRKIAIDGYVINLEIPELTKCVHLMRYTSNNVNQMVRTMNSGGAVDPDEVNNICTKRDETNRLFGEILEQLSQPSSRGGHAGTGKEDWLRSRYVAGQRQTRFYRLYPCGQAA